MPSDKTKKPPAKAGGFPTIKKSKIFEKLVITTNAKQQHIIDF